MAKNLYNPSLPSRKCNNDCVLIDSRYDSDLFKKVHIINIIIVLIAFVSAFTGLFQNWTIASASEPAENSALVAVPHEYSGSYDGAAHGSYIATRPAGTAITYSTSLTGTYTSTYPTYTNVGTYTTYYKAEKTGYTSVSGSITTTITAADPGLTLSQKTVELTEPATTTITATRTGSGAITATSSDTSVATVSVSGTSINIASKSYGTAEITVNVAASGNYAASSVSIPVLVNTNANISITMPTSVTLKAAGDGTLTSASDTSVSNSSKIPIKISSLTTAAKGSAALVKTSAATSNDQIGINITPAGGNAIELSDYIGGATLANPEQWTLASGASKKLTFAGKIGGFSAINPAATTSAVDMGWTGSDARAAASLSLSSTSGDLKYGEPVVLTYSLTGNGSVSAKSSDWSKCTVEVDESAHTITLTPSTDAGTVTITVMASGTNTYKPVTATYTGNVLAAYAMLYTDGSLVFQRGNTPDPNKTLTASYTGFETGTYEAKTDVPWYSNASTITSVSFADAVKPTSCAHWFRELSNCTSMSVENLDTSACTSMYCMFAGSTAAPSAFTQIEGIEGLDTNACTIMRAMFQYCTSLTSLDVSNFNTSSVTNMMCLFYYCTSLTSLDLSNFDTSACTDMTGMFMYCSALTSLDVSNFDTAGVTSMWQTFAGCSSLTSLDLSNFDLSKCNKTRLMFNKCYALASINGIESLDVSAVTDMAGMFQNCYALESLDLSSWNTSSATSMVTLFGNCQNIVSIDISGFDTSNVTDMTGMFNQCYALSTITGLSDLDTSACTNMRGMFYECSSLTTIDVSSFDTSNVTTMENMFAECSSLTTLDVSNFDTSACTTFNWMFKDCSSLASISGLTSLDSSHVVDMNSMFAGCSALTSLDLSSFDTSAVTTASGMFTGCSALSSVELGSSWTFKGATSSRISGMNFPTAPSAFPNNGYWYAKTGTNAGTSYLETEIPDNTAATYEWDKVAYAMLYTDGSMVFQHGNTPDPNKTLTAAYTGFETATYASASVVPWYAERASITSVSFADKIKPASCAYWFYYMQNLSSIDLSKLDTSSVISMSSMFYSCSSLATLDVSNFDTSNVTNMYGIFYDCKSLTTLDVSDFDTTNVTNMYGMFYDCKSLTTLDVSDFDTTNVTNMSSMFYSCSSLATLDVSNFATSNVTDMTYMFCSCKSLTTLDVSNFDTSNVTGMSNMFNSCSALTTLDVSNFDTSNVTSMTYMFNACSSLVTLDVSNFDTANVTSMPSMFDTCKSLTALDVSNFDTSNVTNMTYMFNACSSLAILDVSNFDTSNVTNMLSMFNTCKSLTTLDVSNFDTSNVTNMTGMFNSCSSLATLDVSNFDTSNVTNMTYMFGSCKFLATLDASNFDTSNVTNMTGMFHSCSSLATLDVSNFDTSNVTNMAYMFYDCRFLTSLDLSSFDTSAVTTAPSMFTGCSALSSVTLGTSWSFKGATSSRISGMNFPTAPSTAPNNGYWYAKTGVNAGTSYLETEIPDNTAATYEWGVDAYAMLYTDGSLVFQRGNTPDPDKTLTASYTGFETGTYEAKTDVPWHSERASITSVSFADTIKPASCAHWFRELPNCTSIDLAKLDTSNVTSMLYMFYNCSSLTSLDVSGFNTSNVTNMTYMFSCCDSLTSLDLSTFDTSNVTNMTYMFSCCSSLTSLDVSGFNTSNVTNMDSMFHNCPNLTSLDVSGFNTSNVTNMDCMFYDCKSLATLDVSGFNTSNVSDMGSMFYDCSSLTSLDVSSFNTSNVSNMTYMFSYCKLLTSLDVSGFNTSNVSNMGGMFCYCKLLTSLDVSGFNTSNVTNMGSMFYYCSSLTSLDVSGFNTSNVTSMSFMFAVSDSLTVLDVSNFDTSEVTNMRGMFQYCSPLTLDVSGWDTSKVTDMSYMFNYCSDLVSLDLSSFDTSNVTNMSCMFSACNSLTTIYVSPDTWSTSSVTSSSNMFKNCSSLVGGAGTTYDLSQIDATYARIDQGPSSAAPGYFTKASEAYAIISSSNKTLYFVRSNETHTNGSTGTVTSISGGTYTGTIYTGFETATYSYGTPAPWYFDPERESLYSSVVFVDKIKPASIDYWFDYEDNTEWADISFASANFSNLDVSKCTSLEYVFGKINIDTLDLSGWDTSNVTSIYYLFDRVHQLTSLDLSSWDTSNVTSINRLFNSCPSLASLDLSGWDTSSVTYMSLMFNGCFSLTSLDLSSFDTSNVTSMSSMFYYCNSLTTITVSSSWSTAAVTDSSYMFYGCTSLVGGAGTTYDSSHVDATYAHIDEGTSNPGYLTELRFPAVSISNPDLYYSGSAQTLGTVSVTEPSSGATVLYSDTENGTYTSTCPTQTDIGAYTTYYKVQATGYAELKGSFTTNIIDNTLYAMFYTNDSGSTYTFVLQYSNTAYDTDKYGTLSEAVKTDMTYQNLSKQEGGWISNDVSWGSNSKRKKVTTAVIRDIVKPSSIAWWFEGFKQVTSFEGLENIDLSICDEMFFLFDGCEALTTLDISSFDTTNTSISSTDVTGMFDGCSNLQTIYVGNNWNNTTSYYAVDGWYDPFEDCSTNLVGGAGTTWSSKNTSEKYMRVDGGTSTPGYFTLKTDTYSGPSLVDPSVAVTLTLAQLQSAKADATQAANLEAYAQSAKLQVQVPMADSTTQTATLIEDNDAGLTFMMDSQVGSDMAVNSTGWTANNRFNETELYAALQSGGSVYNLFDASFLSAIMPQDIKVASVYNETDGALTTLSNQILWLASAYDIKGADYKSGYTAGSSAEATFGHQLEGWANYTAGQSGDFLLRSAYWDSDTGWLFVYSGDVSSGIENIGYAVYAVRPCFTL